MLAQSYSLSSDGKQILINLLRKGEIHRTPGLRLHVTFNAEDVVFSINRVLGHDTYLPTLSDDVGSP